MVEGLIFNELPLNITKSENLQMFCHGARNFFYTDKSAF